VWPTDDRSLQALVCMRRFLVVDTMIFIAFSSNLEKNPHRPSNQSPIHADHPIKICHVYATCRMEAFRNFDQKSMWTVWWYPSWRRPSDENPVLPRGCRLPNAHRTNQSSFDTWHVVCRVASPAHFRRNLIDWLIINDCIARYYTNNIDHDNNEDAKVV
jgi:hypothetical protein